MLHKGVLVLGMKFCALVLSVCLCAAHLHTSNSRRKRHSSTEKGPLFEYSARTLYDPVVGSTMSRMEPGPIVKISSVLARTRARLHPDSEILSATRNKGGAVTVNVDMILFNSATSRLNSAISRSNDARGENLVLKAASTCASEGHTCDKAASACSLACSIVVVGSSCAPLPLRLAASCGAPKLAR